MSDPDCPCCNPAISAPAVKLRNGNYFKGIASPSKGNIEPCLIHEKR